jgi:putative colanic acid biosysnthesis UDP-glucose lipid carrier transferase
MFQLGVVKEYQAVFRACLLLFDLFLVLSCGLLAHYVRFNLGVHQVNIHYWGALVASLVIAFFTFQRFGLYEPLREKSLLSYLFDITLAMLIMVGVLSVIGFAIKHEVIYSREWFGYWVSFLWCGLVLSRVVIWALLYFLRRKGFNLKRVMVVGTGKRAQELVKTMQGNLWSGVEIAGFISLDSSSEETSLLGLPVKKMPAQMVTFIRRSKVHEVWIVLPLSEQAVIETIANELISQSMTVRYVPDFFGMSLHQHSMTEISGFPLVNLYSSPMVGVNRFYKECEDKLLSLLFLILGSWLMVLIALAVKFTSPGPILFRQKRHGWNGKIIKVYKFRTMYQHQAAPGEVKQASRHDARITRLGKFLRRTSLDELPQLLNVLQGRMSLVGPRPHAIEHNEHYKKLLGNYMQRYKVKPGITGWAQVSGYRGETKTLDQMERRVAYDRYYIENWSVRFDIKIILLTVVRGFINKNAY